MFSGITQGLYPVVASAEDGTRRVLEVDLAGNAQALELGASVAIDGVCLTVAGLEGTRARFDVIEETLRRTTLGALRRGDRVSAERSLRHGSEVGGHEVSGHVTGTGEIRVAAGAATPLRPTQTVAQATSGERVLQIGLPAADLQYLCPQGFVAVDGSSLTIARLHPDSFEVHLIPETLSRTKLGTKRVGQLVNVELDARTVAVVRSVERALGPLLEPAIARVLAQLPGVPEAVASRPSTQSSQPSATQPRRPGRGSQDPN